MEKSFRIRKLVIKDSYSLNHKTGEIMSEIIHGEIRVKTNQAIEVTDITSSIQGWVSEKRCQEGIILAFSVHTTAGIVINEAESGLLQDIESQLKEIVPPGAGYKHDRIDSNAHSHIMTSIVSPSETIPINSGSLSMGTWQRVLFVEGDGPRSRRVSMTFIGKTG